MIAEKRFRVVCGLLGVCALGALVGACSGPAPGTDEAANTSTAPPKDATKQTAQQRTINGHLLGSPTQWGRLASGDNETFFAVETGEFCLTEGEVGGQSGLYASGPLVDDQGRPAVWLASHYVYLVDESGQGIYELSLAESTSLELPRDDRGRPLVQFGPPSRYAATGTAHPTSKALGPGLPVFRLEGVTALSLLDEAEQEP